jgi:hypothetical protein
MEITAVSILMLTITTIIGLLIKAAFKKISEAAGKEDIKQIEDSISKNSESDLSSRKEIWIEINKIKERFARLEGKIDKE